MNEIVQTELDKTIAQVEAKLQELLAIRNNLVEAKKQIEVAFGAVLPQVPVKVTREERVGGKDKRRKVEKKYSWSSIREVLKQLYPEMLTVTQIAEVSGIPRSIVSYHTSANRRLLKREYVKRDGGKLHWEYKMTLKNPPHVDGVVISGKDVEDHKPILAIDRM